MKVTVCFGSVRVVVPCGDGDLLVRDLVREAILRYRKATGKGSDSWIAVHNLQSHGGGILDPDDRLHAVVDDREQILASFEDGDGAHLHGGGDGASGSSAGTGSPDLFHDGEHKYGPLRPADVIEVTGAQIAAGPGGGLQVRRGSEPSLGQLPAGPPAARAKRWSAAPLIVEPLNGSRDHDDDDDEEEEGELAGFRRVANGSGNRLSMQFLGDGGGYRWAEAAERAAMQSRGTSLPREGKRREPLGQANSGSSPVPMSPNEQAELIIIRNEPGPLGIHVVPDYDRLGKDRGLLVQGIEPGKRIDRDGRLSIFDRIIEINGESLLNMPFQRVQDIFKLYLTSPELRLKVVKKSILDSLRKPPPPIYPRFPDDKENVSMVECEQKQSTNTKVATVSPTKKVPAISKNLKSLLSANTRKLGRKIEIDLVKGAHGLGFSITTRDNPAGGNCPIYIKNIIPKGAAVDDGRLKIGDRLLEVNGVEMTGKSQTEAVSILRNAPSGSTVRIVVSRQEDVLENGLPRIIDNEQEKETEQTNNNPEPPTIPPLPQSHLLMQQSRQNNNFSENGGNTSVAKIISQFQEAAHITPNERTEDQMIFPWKHREIVTLDIPVHDSEKAGLGISVKGKTSGEHDLGIFIKNVITGGAASRDKRLRTNDQLLNVNGISLLQQSNSDAMETLRKAMLHTEGPVPGNITLTIARRAPSPGANRSYTSSRGSDSNLLNTSIDYVNDNNGTNKSSDTELSRSNNSGSSTNTVIFNPNIGQNAARLGMCAPSLESEVIANGNKMATWNPVLDRLTGSKNSQLRNESYYKATHNATWLGGANSPPMHSFGAAATLNMSGSEPIMIEDEYGSSRVLTTHSSARINVFMTNKLNGSGTITENRSDHEPDGKATINLEVNKTGESNTTPVPANDATYASQLSLENPQGFSRDAFGRQSMSEKRHATLDAKSTDTYQKSKKIREERKTADKLGQLGPSLGMKKSSSLESLQTMVQEIQMQDECDPAYSYRGAAAGPRVIRGRGCDASFRAAVDDPNHRSEAGAKKHWLLDGPGGRRAADGFGGVRGGARQSSLNAALDAKHKGKKKAGLLKGIGSMFRFGKHRKAEFGEPAQCYSQVNEFGEQTAEQEQHQQQDSEFLSRALQQQQQRSVPEDIYQSRQQQLHSNAFVHRHAEQVLVIPENQVAPPVKYRPSEQVQQARRKMQEQQRLRHTYYQDEGIYDQRMNINQYGGQPGSRSGITESVPFTHYVNFNELQSRLRSKDPLSDSQIVQMRLQVQQQRLKVEEESRKQHQYHSQRQVRTDNQLRPVSNFYEYESIQSMLNNRQQPPQPATSQVVYQQAQMPDLNSNSLPRQGQQPVQGRRGQTEQRGPFVTHVKIGEHPKQNGTKV